MRTTGIMYPARLITALFLTFAVLSPDGNTSELSASRDVEKLDCTLPLNFMENPGAPEGEAAFTLIGSDKTLFFSGSGIAVALSNREKSESAVRRWIVKLDFVNADRNVHPRGDERQSAVISRFTGSREKWETGIATFRRLVYRDLWAGIDLVFSIKGNRLKYDFVVKPGADPSSIRLRYRGAEKVALTKSGTLEISTPLGGFEDGRPCAWQVLDGVKAGVSMAYAPCPGSGRSRFDDFEYGFDVGSYDPRKTLILDPDMLIYCGYIGGDNNEGGLDIAVDDQGCAYIAGTTDSLETTFPVCVGPDLTANSSVDGFVAKISADGAALLYCGYIGGSGEDCCCGIDVDSLGNAYVAGYTSSKESSFPVTVGPDLTYNGGWHEAFVARVDATGTALDYCGYIGGASDDYGFGLAVDPGGTARVVGSTWSDEATFPVRTGPDLTYNGGPGDAFVAQVNAAGTLLDFCGYIGGASEDLGARIALDQSGNAYVTSKTLSDASTFPVNLGPDVSYNGGPGDAFVACVDAQGTHLHYCGYIGGDGEDFGSAVAVDADGSAVVAGSTDSDETTFPDRVGPDLSCNGGFDGFAARISVDGTAVLHCGYIGGANDDLANCLALDPDGNIYVTGQTASDRSTFPVAVGPDLTHNGGLTDAFAARIASDGTKLDYCGYIGGAEEESGYGIAVDASGSAFVAGCTSSDEASFPVRTGPDLSYNGDYSGPSGPWVGDAFAARIPPFHVLLRAGNANSGVGDAADLLRVNGSAGEGPYRRVVIPTGGSVTVEMDAPPAGPASARFTLYVHLGEAGIDDVAVQPHDIGTACFPTPLSNGVPWRPPITAVNNIGWPWLLGDPVLASMPPAPIAIGPWPLQPGFYTLQGFIEDGAAAGGTLSLTNAVVVEVK